MLEVSRGLDARVAELCFLAEIEWKDDEPYWDPSGGRSPLPPFSGNLESAWRLVGCWVDEGAPLALVTEGTYGKAPFRWALVEVHFAEPRGRQERGSAGVLMTQHIPHACWEATPALAICNAVLRWAGHPPSWMAQTAEGDAEAEP